MLFVPLKLSSLTIEAIMSYFPDPTEIYCNKLVCVNCQNCLTCTDKFVLCHKIMVKAVMIMMTGRV